MKLITVIYHNFCYDGAGAKYAFWRKFGDDAEYIPCTYYDKSIPKLSGGDTLYIADFSFPYEVLEEWSKIYDQIILLDHHKTAFDHLSAYVGKDPKIRILIDNDKSGALLAWEYMHDEEAPMLIRMISDRDLWQFKIPGSKELHQYLVSNPMDMNLYHLLANDHATFHQAIELGKALLQQYNQLVENICKHAWWTYIDGHKVPIVNTTIAWSEVGEYLVHKYADAPFAASFTVHGEKLQFSLRSSGFDVAKVAEKFNGGGHKKAAGFVVPINHIEKFASVEWLEKYVDAYNHPKMILYGSSPNVLDMSGKN
jgi:nanoRNase/pAp phosphatase (c-di-AMP/oligoRNAs hydrolase)